VGRQRVDGASAEGHAKLCVLAACPTTAPLAHPADALLCQLFPAEISGRSEELAVARAEHAASLAEEARQRAAQAAERAAHPLTMGPGRGSAMFLFQISSQAFSPPVRVALY